MENKPCNVLLHWIWLQGRMDAFSKTGVAMKQFQSEDPKITCHLSRNALRNVETHAKPTQ